MNKKLMEVLEKEIITAEEYDFIAEQEEVLEIENCGASGKYIEKTWYNVKLNNGEEYSIYL
ncbi:MAG: hypothetical protein PHE29_13470 [Tissierellia bacterium]|nr:hypothetical protein [Tissierellia bacterium]MDD4779227.1 hypothetical protein [Tissierellia bacterium]